jgi:hypothetical protein
MDNVIKITASIRIYIRVLKILYIYCIITNKNAL